MDKVKARKQDNDIMVPLAKKFNVTEGQEFYVTKESDGIISLIPMVNDYFEDVTVGEFVDEEDE